ncbi:Ig-like domain-containing protein [Halobacteriales archaeon Cl-PHB]
MSLRDDQRGQSIQIGAVLLFGVLIISFATYQAFIVPNQNEGVESNHVAEVRQDMQELRNAIASVPSTGAGESVTVSLGTTYSPRVVAVNPPPPSGNLRTLGTSDGAVNLTVANARATDDEVRDRWTGRNYSFNTGGLAFQPGYNEYRNPPTIVYENTVLFESFRDGNLTTTGQSLVDGNRLRLVALNGSLAESKTGAVSVDVQAVSASSTAISVTNESGSNVTIDFASRRSASTWENLFRKDDQWHTQAGHVYDVTETTVSGSPFNIIHLELERDETYTLQMAKVGVGTRTTSEDATYLSPVTEDGKTVQAGSSTEVVVEVRDRFNNPVTGVSVNASADQGEIADSPATSNADGEAVFQYNASGSGSAEIEFSLVGPPGGDFNTSAPENATVSVDVSSGGNGGGATSATWYSPSVDDSGGLSSCSASECTFDVGEHGDSVLTLRAGTDPDFDGVQFHFNSGNNSVGYVTPSQNTTDIAGNATTDFAANANGDVYVTALSSAGSDRILLHIINASGGGGSTNPPVVNQFTVSNPASSGNKYDVTYNVSDSDSDMTNVTLVLENSNNQAISTETVFSAGTTGSVSGTTQLKYGGSDQPDHVRLIAKDQSGNVVEQTEPVP